MKLVRVLVLLAVLVAGMLSTGIFAAATDDLINIPSDVSDPGLE